MADEEQSLFWPELILNPVPRFPHEPLIQSLERLIENKQAWLFYQCPDKEYEPLFSGREAGEGTLGQRGDPELLQELYNLPVLLRRGWPMSHDIEKAGCHGLDGAERFGEVKVQFR